MYVSSLGFYKNNNCGTINISVNSRPNLILSYPVQMNMFFAACKVGKHLNLIRYILLGGNSIQLMLIINSDFEGYSFQEANCIVS